MCGRGVAAGHAVRRTFRSDEGRQRVRRPRGSRPCRRGRASPSCPPPPRSRWPARWPGRPAACPRCSSSIAPVQIWAIGLAMPLPAMSGAEPCTGSNIDGYSFSGLMLPPGAMPDRAGDGAGRDRTGCRRRGSSPTTTSNQSGCWTKWAVRMSMWYWAVLTSGYSLRHRGEALVPVRHAVDDAVRLGRRRDVLPAAASGPARTRSA